MDKESSSSNIEWKKTGFDFNEKATRKTDVRKIVEKEAKDKNAGLKKFTPSPAELPNGLKKIRKKVKQVFDEDEDEDEYQIVSSGADLNSTLLNALQENEKKFLKQNDDIKTVNSLQKVGRDQAVINAEKIAKDAGVKKIDKDVLARNLNDITIGKDTTTAVIAEQASKSFKYKKMQLSEKDTKKLLIGAKKMQALAGKEVLNQVAIEDVIAAGDKNKGVEDTKIILKKTGRVNNDGKPIKKTGGDLKAKTIDMIEKVEKTKSRG